MEDHSDQRRRFLSAGWSVVYCGEEDRGRDGFGGLDHRQQVLEAASVGPRSGGARQRRSVSTRPCHPLWFHSTLSIHDRTAFTLKHKCAGLPRPLGDRSPVPDSTRSRGHALCCLSVQVVGRESVTRRPSCWLRRASKAVGFFCRRKGEGSGGRGGIGF